MCLWQKDRGALTLKTPALELGPQPASGVEVEPATWGLLASQEGSSAVCEALQVVG